MRSLVIRWPERNEIPVWLENVGSDVPTYIEAWYLLRQCIIYCSIWLVVSRYFSVYFAVFVCIHCAFMDWKSDLLQCSWNVWPVGVTWWSGGVTEGARTVTRSEYTPSQHHTTTTVSEYTPEHRTITEDVHVFWGQPFSKFIGFICVTRFSITMYINYIMWCNYSLATSMNSRIVTRLTLNRAVDNQRSNTCAVPVNPCANTGCLLIICRTFGGHQLPPPPL